MRIPSLTQACHHSLRVLVLALAAGYALAEDAARVDFAAGEVTVITAAGESRALKKGDMIAGGDRIETGRGRVQLRFADGAYVALQPNTVFRVDQYLYANQPAGQQSAFFSLVKGGMRTVTGTIGKANRDNYKVKTPVATIGIRGTGYSALQTGAQLLVSVNTGLVAVLNDLGETLAGAGQNVAVTPETQPTLTTEQVHFNGEAAAAGTDEHTEGGSDTEEGTEESTVADSEASSDVVVADTSYSPEINSCPDTSCDSVADIEKAIGQPIQSEQPLHLIVARNGVTAKGNYFEQGSDKLVVTVTQTTPATAASTAATTTSQIELLRAELENNGTLSNYLSRDDVNSPWAQEADGWGGTYIRGGSWNNGDYQFLANTSTLTGGQFLHYVGGELTPIATIDNLVTNGGKLDYTLIGASSANNAAGTKNLFLDSGSLLRVNFLSSQMAVYMKLTDSSTQPVEYIIDKAGNIQWQTYSANSHDARFTLSLTGSNHASCSACDTNITGFFAGPNANELGIGYTVIIPTLTDTFEGTAGFGTSGSTEPQGLFIAYSSPASTQPKYHGEYVASGQPMFHPVEDSNGLISGDQGGVIKLTRDSGHVGAGAAQQTTAGVTAGLHWGSWGPGDYQYDNAGSPTTFTLGSGQRLHYVYGDMTSLADMQTLAQNTSSKIAYGLASATAVTDPAGLLAAGSLDPSSGLKFNFGLGTIDAHLVFNNFASVTSSVVDNANVALTWGPGTGTPGGPANDARFNVTVLDSSCVSVCNQTASLVGFFSGTQAQAVGVSYNAILGGNNATGAAVFTKVP